MVNKKKGTNDFRSSEFYSAKYTEEEWLNQRLLDAQQIVDRLEKYGLVSPHMTVLDAGCGSGELGAQFISRYGSKCYGMDLNDTAVRQAKKLGVMAKRANLDETWPFGRNSFHLVVGTEIIEHVLNPDHFLEESARVLKSHGYLVITTPNLAVWFNRLLFLLGYQPFFLEASTVDKTVGLGFTRNLTPNRTPVGHVRCFTLRAITDLLTLHGFSVEKTVGLPVYYLPKYLRLLDFLSSSIPDLSTDLFLVAKKI
jgi:SAM-dependent methyltransferase